VTTEGNFRPAGLLLLSAEGGSALRNQARQKRGRKRRSSSCGEGEVPALQSVKEMFKEDTKERRGKKGKTLFSFWWKENLTEVVGRTGKASINIGLGP